MHFQRARNRYASRWNARKADRGKVPVRQIEMPTSLFGSKSLVQMSSSHDSDFDQLKKYGIQTVIQEVKSSGL